MKEKLLEKWDKRRDKLIKELRSSSGPHTRTYAIIEHRIDELTQCMRDLSNMKTGFSFKMWPFIKFKSDEQKKRIRTTNN